MHYYPHHIGDFIRDTANLSDAQCMAYLRLCWRYYGDEKPLDESLEDLAFAVKADEKMVGLILRHYFTQEADGWHHKRIDEEIAVYHAKSEKARASANARWRGANALPTDSEGNADGPDFDANQEPRTKNQSKTILPPAVPAEGDDEGPHGPGAGLSRPTGMPRVAPTPGASGERFDDFWKAWPKNERKQDKAKCLAKWKRGRLDLVADTILADIAVKRKTQKWIDGFVEAPLVYLNGSRWEDGVQPQEPGQEAQTVQSWWDTRGGVEKRAAELFLPAWTGIDDATGKQIPWAAYRATVIDAAVKAGEVIS